MTSALMTETAAKVLAVSIEYLGPAAQKFLERQTRGHMDGLEFELLERFHLEQLSWWVGVSAKLVIDKEKAKELSDKIAAISKQ